MLGMLSACTNDNSTHTSTPPPPAPLPNYITVDTFQTFLDSASMKGSILIYDANLEQYYSNDHEYAKLGSLPASTYKIPNSIIALETGVVEDDSTLFEWDGEPRGMEIWEQDLVFRDAFHFSCVPCYQQIARSIGVKRMREYVALLSYGEMVMDSSSIDLFWLEGDSKISQMEQIQFLQNFHNELFTLKPRTYSIMKKLMVIDSTNAYTLRGKTGWAIREGNNTGWFVGYITTETKAHPIFFATRIEPPPNADMDNFTALRKGLTMKGLRYLEFLKLYQ